MRKPSKLFIKDYCSEVFQDFQGCYPWDPWDWYIYLRTFTIKTNQMWVNISFMGASGSYSALPRNEGITPRSIIMASTTDHLTRVSKDLLNPRRCEWPGEFSRLKNGEVWIPKSFGICLFQDLRIANG